MPKGIKSKTEKQEKLLNLINSYYEFLDAHILRNLRLLDPSLKKLLNMSYLSENESYHSILFYEATIKAVENNNCKLKTFNILKQLRSNVFEYFNEGTSLESSRIFYDDIQAYFFNKEVGKQKLSNLFSENDLKLILTTLQVLKFISGYAKNKEQTNKRSSHVVKNKDEIIKAEMQRTKLPFCNFIKAIDFLVNHKINLELNKNAAYDYSSSKSIALVWREKYKNEYKSLISTLNLELETLAHPFFESLLKNESIKQSLTKVTTFLYEVQNSFLPEKLIGHNCKIFEVCSILLKNIELSINMENNMGLKIGEYFNLMEPKVEYNMGSKVDQGKYYNTIEIKKHEENDFKQSVSKYFDDPKESNTVDDKKVSELESLFESNNLNFRGNFFMGSELKLEENYVEQGSPNPDGVIEDIHKYFEEEGNNSNSYSENAPCDNKEKSGDFLENKSCEESRKQFLELKEKINEGSNLLLFAKKNVNNKNLKDFDLIACSDKIIVTLIDDGMPIKLLKLYEGILNSYRSSQLSFLKYQKEQLVDGLMSNIANRLKGSNVKKSFLNLLEIGEKKEAQDDDSQKYVIPLGKEGEVFLSLCEDVEKQIEILDSMEFNISVDIYLSWSDFKECQSPENRAAFVEHSIAWLGVATAPFASSIRNAQFSAQSSTPQPKEIKIDIGVLPSKNLWSENTLRNTNNQSIDLTKRSVIEKKSF